MFASLAEALSVLTTFFREQYGFPDPKVERAIDALGYFASVIETTLPGAAPAPAAVRAPAAPTAAMSDDLAKRLGAIEEAFTALKTSAPAASATPGELDAPIRPAM